MSSWILLIEILKNAYFSGAWLTKHKAIVIIAEVMGKHHYAHLLCVPPGKAPR